MRSPSDRSKPAGQENLRGVEEQKKAAHSHTACGNNRNSTQWKSSEQAAHALGKKP